MKLKSLLLNNLEDIIYIAVYKDCWSQVYYQDRHYEIYNMTVNKLLKHLNNNRFPTRVYKSNYHSPIRIENTLFSPTANIKQSHCEYFNLLKIEEKDIFYIDLLADKQLLDTAKRRFIDYKTKQIFD